MPCEAGHYISDEEALEAQGMQYKFIPYSRRDKRIARLFLIVGAILGSGIGATATVSIWALIKAL